MALLLLLSSCTDPWRNVYTVEGLRVLAVRAEPPDLRPGESTHLDALVVDPRAPKRLNTLIWLACHPNAEQLDQPECAKYDTLATFNGGSDGAVTKLPEGLVALGMTPPATITPYPIVYQAPADVFSKLPADDPHRFKGVIAIVLMLAIAEEPPASWPPTEQDLLGLLTRARNKEVDSLLTIKRLRVSENPTPNHNPVFQKLRVGEEDWGPGLRPVKVFPGTWTPLYSFAAEGSYETFQDLDADGNVVEKTEHLSTSWFTTFGELDKDRTVEGEIDKPAHVFAPYVLADIPDDRRGILYAVMRDSRGGVDTHVRGFLLCDPSLPSPVISAIEPASGPPGSFIRIKGEHLEDLIDARAGTGWLSAASWNDTEQAYVGAIPSDAPAGEIAIVPRGKDCGAGSAAKFIVTTR